MTISTTSRKKILIADDYAPDRRLIRRALSAGYSVREAESVAEAVAAFECEDFFLAFVDVFLQPDDLRASGIDLGQRMAKQFPVIYVSSKEDQTQKVLNSAQISDYLFLDKNKDFGDSGYVARRIDEVSSRYYSSIDITFRDHSLTWKTVVDKFFPASEQRDDYAQELDSLVRRAMNGWDEAASLSVKANKIELALMGQPGDNSVVFQVAPFAADKSPQAHVVLKLSRVVSTLDREDRNDRSDHTQFNRYKNVVGGYGLRERRHSRRCTFRAQVFAIPYFELAETCTYLEFFQGELGDAGGLQRIAALTTFVFNRALSPLNHRFLTGDEVLPLSTYYAKRIKSSQRLAAIRSDLTSTTRPSSLLYSDSHVTTHSGRGARELLNPILPVLERHSYRCVDECVSTQLRHGDFHAENVVVDRQHLCAWYLDYESMDETHFHMVDHVEFESDVLFSLMDIDDDFELLAMVIDAITGPGLSEFGEIVWAGATASHRDQANKALAAVKAIRVCARRVLPPGGVRPYYHGLMYEALRVAGKITLKLSQRWRALVAAAVIFDKLEKVYADA